MEQIVLLVQMLSDRRADRLTTMSESLAAAMADIKKELNGYHGGFPYKIYTCAEDKQKAIRLASDIEIAVSQEKIKRAKQEIEEEQKKIYNLKG